MKLQSISKGTKGSSPYNRNWILKNSLEIIQEYNKGILSIRGLHYRLVDRGMTNDIRHYKKVGEAMKFARWDNLIDFDFFVDNERDIIGRTRYEETTVESSLDNAKYWIEYYMNNYYKNNWENQENYVEVFIEKKALQGVFKPICEEMGVALVPCKGYPSLTFLNEARLRFDNAYLDGKDPIILYFGDYDPSGEDIPRSIVDNLSKMGCNVELDRRLLLKQNVIDWKLPCAPIKEGDTRSKEWDGIGQVELDSIDPKKLQRLCREAINEYFDKELYNDLLELQRIEKIEYKSIIKNFINNL